MGDSSSRAVVPRTTVAIAGEPPGVRDVGVMAQVDAEGLPAQAREMGCGKPPAAGVSVIVIGVVLPPAFTLAVVEESEMEKSKTEMGWTADVDRA